MNKCWETYEFKANALIEKARQKSRLSQYYKRKGWTETVEICLEAKKSAMIGARLLKIRNMPRAYNGRTEWTTPRLKTPEEILP